MGSPDDFTPQLRCRAGSSGRSQQMPNQLRVVQHLPGKERRSRVSTECRGPLPTPEARIMAMDLRLRGTDRADEQRRRACVASRGPVAQKQQWNRQRSGEPFCRADAECRGHLSAAEPERVGATDRLLSGPVRGLRASFFVAPRSPNWPPPDWPLVACHGLTRAEPCGEPLRDGVFPARYPRSLRFLGGRGQKRCKLSRVMVAWQAGRL